MAWHRMCSRHIDGAILADASVMDSAADFTAGCEDPILGRSVSAS